MENSYKKYFDLEAIISAVKLYSSVFDEKKFIRAFEFAEKAHRGQMRKDNKTPYIVHPVKIVEMLIRFHADEDTLIAALLHDVPEDTEYKISDVKKLFGDTVAFLVDGITKLSKVYYRNNMPSRQVKSLKKLFLHNSEDIRGILIKLADRLNNMQTLGNIEKEEKRLRIARETLEIYVPIANLLGIQELKYQLEDLCFMYLFPNEYRQVAEKRKEGINVRKKASKSFIEEVLKLCKKSKIEAEICEREKNLYSIYKKLCAFGETINDIDNRITVRIIVPDVDSCYRVLGLIHGKYLPKNDRFKDYIANPKANSYRSLHTTIFGSDGLLTEVQIRTKEMHLDSEYGVVSSFFLKNKLAADQKRTTWVKEVLKIEKVEKDSDNFLASLKLDIFQDRIFVFTPKGEPIDLPKDACVLDFAYAIHGELGNHAKKANINGKIKNISTVLKTGDVVNVLTSGEISPDLSWLSFVKTNAAINKILAYLKKISNERKINDGKKILQKQFDIAGLGLYENMSFRRINKSIQDELSRSFGNLDDVLKAIGSGDLKATDVIRSLQVKYKHLNRFSGQTEKPGTGIRVKIKIVAKNRFGLLRDISEVLYEHALDMYALKGWASRYEEDAYFTTDILVEDLVTVSQIFNKLEQIEDVLYVYRVTRGAFWATTIASVLTAMFWVLHPFLLRLFIDRGLGPSNDVFDAVVIYGSLFLLVVAVLYLASILRKYFPYVRKKKLIWIVSFLIPILASVALTIELVYFEQEISWIVIFLEILLIYGYVISSFVSFRKTMEKT